MTIIHRQKAGAGAATHKELTQGEKQNYNQVLAGGSPPPAPQSKNRGIKPQGFSVLRLDLSVFDSLLF